ncbi:MAG: hypothetical protein IIC76_15700, partial [Bacteroidetes bacterium]|nr:hypothetical protein [Bacteroidota bacterium]
MQLYHHNHLELNGELHIEDLGDVGCFISYRSDLTMDCNYTKNQIKFLFEIMEENELGDVAGPFFYFTDYFDLKFRMLGEILKDEINKTYGKMGGVGNLTLGEDLL